jgi:hypothetical protein
MSEFTGTSIAIIGLGLFYALAVLKWTYEKHREIDRRRRYVDLGARFAEAAGFRLESYSDGAGGAHPSYTFWYGFHPHQFVLIITGDGWRAYEPGHENKPEPKFDERGDVFSTDHFRSIAQEYEATVRRNEDMSTRRSSPSIELSARR